LRFSLQVGKPPSGRLFCKGHREGMIRKIVICHDRLQASKLAQLAFKPSIFSCLRYLHGIFRIAAARPNAATNRRSMSERAYAFI
jgi:hypothetical protein